MHMGPLFGVGAPVDESEPTPQNCMESFRRLGDPVALVAGRAVPEGGGSLMCCLVRRDRSRLRRLYTGALLL